MGIEEEKPTVRGRHAAAERMPKRTSASGLDLPPSVSIPFPGRLASTTESMPPVSGPIRTDNPAATGAHAALPSGAGAHASREAEAFAGADAAGRGTRGGRGRKQRKPRKPSFLRRIINEWFNRLVGAVSDGSLADQEEEYAAHRTTRDYVWNTIGIGLWGGVFPLLTIVVTQLAGVEAAGMFSMAFVTGLLLMFVANYGVRTYQVSDLDEEHTFSDYQINRVITCVIMVIAGIGYCFVRGYGEDMFVICMGVYLYKMIDGLADVYEGRLQQVDKLYLAGISQALRSLAAVVVFSFVLLITRNVGIASVAMAVAAFVTFLLLTLPLAFLETPRSSGWSMASVLSILKQCFPLFVALFMYNLIDNMPKFVMEGVLSYDNQLYFNAMYFPAHAILLMVGFVYKPLLVRMAAVWADRRKRRRFDLIIVAILALTVVVTFAAMVVIGTIGIPIMNFLYGLDFDQFRDLFYIMIAAGGMTAAIEFLYQVITVLRRQAAIMKLYLITFGFSLFIPVLLVNFTGLPGAVIGYLIIMSILFVLLIWEYITIRLDFAKDSDSDSGAGFASAAAPADSSREMAKMPASGRPQAARRNAAPLRAPAPGRTAAPGRPAGSGRTAAPGRPAGSGRTAAPARIRLEDRESVRSRIYEEPPVIAVAPEDGPMSWKALSLRASRDGSAENQTPDVRPAADRDVQGDRQFQQRRSRHGM